jgi:ribosomal protein S18 acetylase RimI-like enzyme
VEITLRPATPEDAAVGTALLARSMAGFGDALLGLGSHARQLAVLEHFWRRSDNRFSHRLCELALVEGEIAGLVLSYAGARSTALNFGVARGIFRVYSLREALRFVRLALTEAGVTEVLRDEYLLSNLAVFPGFEGRGVGRFLLHRADELARATGVRRITLTVEIGNERARGLYLSHGYRVIQRHPTPHLKRLLATIGTERLIKDI